MITLIAFIAGFYFGLFVFSLCRMAAVSDGGINFER